MPASWFYMPPIPWTLETKGAFSLDSWDFPTGSTDYLPTQVPNEGWKASLEKASIEGVISNLDQQLSNATTEDHFEAFRFYYENDAFVVV